MVQVITLEADEVLDIESMERNGHIPDEAMATADDILRDVKKRGDAAVLEYTARFDNVKLKKYKVPRSLIDKAEDHLDSKVAKALIAAYDNICEFHKNKVPVSNFDFDASGSMVGYKVTPIDSVGLYVPGGSANYPSTVLMNAIPAVAAGVPRICMVTPPDENGNIAPSILFAAKLCGITEIYAVGGAQAIGALTYGTETVDKVDKIVGPGNLYVTAAKALVEGEVGIDFQAGPSEVLILADKTSNPTFIAADMVAQAEHDPNACCYLITTSEAVVEKVLEEINTISASSKRKQIIDDALDENGLIVVCKKLSTAILTANEIAPEHLEILCANPMEIVGSIRNAGAVFVGPWSPVAVGDYYAGPSHTLPTSGTARFSNPLTADDFVKKTSIINWSYLSLYDNSKPIIDIARNENLDMHARSVEERIRFVGDEIPTDILNNMWIPTGSGDADKSLPKFLDKNRK